MQKGSNDMKKLYNPRLLFILLFFFVVFRQMLLAREGNGNTFKILAAENNEQHHAHRDGGVGKVEYGREEDKLSASIRAMS